MKRNELGQLVDEQGNVIQETQEEKDFVSKKELEKVLEQLHKFKKATKDQEAELNRIRAEKDAAERASLEEKAEYKKLYELEQKERQQLLQQRQAEQEQFINHHKRMAVIEKLGGFKNPSYSSFVNVNSIELDENKNIVQASVDAEVNRIRQEHPELLKSTTSNIPGGKAPNNPLNPNQEVDWAKMSPLEQVEFMKSQIKF